MLYLFLFFASLSSFGKPFNFYLSIPSFRTFFLHFLCFPILLFFLNFLWFLLKTDVNFNIFTAFASHFDYFFELFFYTFLKTLFNREELFLFQYWIISQCPSPASVMCCNDYVGFANILWPIVIRKIMQLSTRTVSFYGSPLWFY